MIPLNIDFVDFWPGFDKKDNMIYKLLASKYDVRISRKPDFIFYSLFGDEHLRYDYSCVRIYYTGENVSPDFATCDYAMGFDYISFADRYIRFPLFLMYDSYSRLYDRTFPDDEQLLNRKFCSFVVSNHRRSSPIREEFYKRLSKYKKVDSGGRMYNNVGGPVPDKLNFISDYKFNIAFENSVLDGYTTEKIVEPFAVNTLPIYWGNPSVEKDFNKDSFVNVSSFRNLDDAVDFVIGLDRNDSEYLKILKQPCLLPDAKSIDDLKDSLLEFLSHIVEQGPSKAKRVPEYGFVRGVRTKRLEDSNIVRNLGFFRGLFKYGKKK